MRRPITLRNNIQKYVFPWQGGAYAPYATFMATPLRPTATWYSARPSIDVPLAWRLFAFAYSPLTETRMIMLCASSFISFTPIVIPPPMGERGVLWWACLSVCVCVCLSVRDRISGTTRPIFTEFFMHVTYGRDSALLWRRIVICYLFPVLWMTSYLHISWGHSTSPPGWGSEAHTYLALRLARIPVAGSGRSGLLLAVRACQAAAGLWHHACTECSCVYRNDVCFK